MHYINNATFIQNLIEQFINFGASDFLILTSSKNNQIEACLKNYSNNKIDLFFHHSSINTKIVKRILNAKHLLKEVFFLNYGDVYSPINLKKYLDFFYINEQPTMVGYKSLSKKYVNNFSTKGNFFNKFHENISNLKKNHFKNIGYFIIKKKDLIISKKNFYFENDINNFISKKIKVYKSYNNYYTLTDTARIPECSTFFSKQNKYVLIDRDGVINKKAKKGFYITSAKEFKLKKNVIEALKIIQRKKYKIIIITNQAGLSRNLITKKNLGLIHDKLINLCNSKGVFNICGVYFCGSFNNNNFYRKPNPGMLHKAENDFIINPYETYFCGDDYRDMEAAQLAGFKKYLISNQKDLYYFAKKILD
jgi:D-glycero-D-manno-heptose 1,7-bisphosphate phosphatase